TTGVSHFVSTGHAPTITARVHAYPSDIIIGRQVVVDPLSATISFNPSSVTGGVQNSTGTITLGNPAPAGGATVTLASNAPTVAQPDVSVTIPAGSSSATFNVTTFATSADKTVTITATLPGGATARGTLTVLAQVASAASLVINPNM